MRLLQRGIEELYSKAAMKAVDIDINAVQRAREPDAAFEQLKLLSEREA